MYTINMRALRDRQQQQQPSRGVGPSNSSNNEEQYRSPLNFRSPSQRQKNNQQLIKNLYSGTATIHRIAHCDDWKSKPPQQRQQQVFDHVRLCL
mmetsp:Transcript_28094/g.41501  ORF Transcript_28094/g.41501 Transcript_28094/m.41501 type:complete len:94 (+) Transcript_28094:46-327(+)